MREEYCTPEMEITIFGPKNVVTDSVTGSNSNFVDPPGCGNDDGEIDEW